MGTAWGEVVAVEAFASPPSFDDYVAARGRHLLRTAWLLTGDHQKAEDLVQTALGKCWPRWGRITASGSGSYDAYVRRVMVTTYIAWWRRRWNAEVVTERLPETGEDGGVDRLLQRRDLQVALAALPRGQRAVLVLRYFEDLTEAQVADALDCSVGTVKSQAARGLATLRRSALLSDAEVRHD